MIAVIRLSVEYRDGRTEQVQADQYAVAVWERWAAKNGLRVAPDNPGPLAFTQLRVMAWAAQQREAKRKVPFEEWDAGVVEVSSGAAEPVDPTKPVTLAG